MDDVFTDLCQDSGPLSHSSTGLLVALLRLVENTGLLPGFCLFLKQNIIYISKLYFYHMWQSWQPQFEI